MDPLSSVERLAALEISGVLQTHNYDRLMARCKLVYELLDVDRVQVNALDDQHINYAAEWPELPKRRRRTKVRSSGCVEVLLAEQTLIVPNALTHPIMCLKEWTDTWLGYLGSPLIFRGQIIGTMCALTHEPRQWTGDDVNVLEGIASQVSTLLTRDERHQ